MILNTINDIASYAQVNDKKVVELLTSKIIPCITTGTNRTFYYTTDSLIDFSVSMIEKNKNERFSSYKDAFLEKDIDSSIFEGNKKCEVITITNQKGGVGKTTSSANIATILSFLGKKVLLVDMDSQAQSSRYFQKVSFKDKSILNLFEKYRADLKIKKDDVKKYINRFEFDDYHIDILPSELKLAKMLELLRMNRMPHTILDNIISTVKDEYDYIIVDTPPYSGLSLEMALYATDKIILATEAEEFSIEGLEVTVEEIKELVKSTNKKVKVDGIVVNSFIKKRQEQEEALDSIVDILVDLELEEKNLMIIKESSIVAKSQAIQLPILEYKLKPKDALLICEPLIDYCTNLILEN